MQGKGPRRGLVVLVVTLVLWVATVLTAQQTGTPPPVEVEAPLYAQ